MKHPTCDCGTPHRGTMTRNGWWHPDPPWEDVTTICPTHGCAPTVFRGERAEYEVAPHGRMGNASYREAERLGCARCLTGGES